MKKAVSLWVLVGMVFITCFEAYSQTQATESVCFEKAVSKALVVTVAEVEEVNFRPGFLNGNGVSLTLRAVKYKVKEILKGNISTETAWVSFVLSERVNYLDTESPALSSLVFRKGNEHILALDKSDLVNFLTKQDKRKVGTETLYEPYRYTCAFLNANEQNLSYVKRLITTSSVPTSSLVKLPDRVQHRAVK